MAWVFEFSGLTYAYVGFRVLGFGGLEVRVQGWEFGIEGLVALQDSSRLARLSSKALGFRALCFVVV